MKKVHLYIICLFVVLFISNKTNASVFYQDLSKNLYVSSGNISNCHDPKLNHQSWAKLKLNQIQEFERYCLRIPVVIDEQSYPSHVQLHLYALASSRVFWDGEFLSESGTVGNNALEETAGAMSHKIPLSRTQLAEGEHILSIDISTFSHLEDMHQIFYAIILIDDNSLGQLERLQLLMPLLLMGAMLLLFLFFLLMYWFYQKDVNFLFFSLLCLFSGTLIFLEILKFLYPYPWDFHVIRLRIMFGVSSITAILLVLYYQSFYQFKVRSWLLGYLVFSVVLIWYLGFSYDARSASLFLMALATGLIINLVAFKKGKNQAKSNTTLLVAAITLLLAAPNAFIDQWFAAFFSFIAILNLYALMIRFNQDRTKALNSLKLETELLRRNLQPHFIMNSLMLIVEWVETQPQLAVEFIEALAEEFRLLNTLSQNKLIPVDQELELCQLHCQIMSSRYQQQVTLITQGETSGIFLPPAILHTIIENAFSHNRMKNGDNITISITHVDNNVKLTVITPYREQHHSGTGTGESYIKARLVEQFEQAWQFKSAPDESSWKTELTVPLVTSIEDSK